MKYLGLLALISTLLSCGHKQGQNAQARSASVPPQIAAADLNLLRQLNQAQIDLLDVAKSVTQPTHALPVSLRAREVAKRIDPSGCAGPEWTDNRATFDNDWESKVETPPTENCPIRYQRRLRFQKDEHHLVIDSELKVKRADLAAISDLSELTIKGDMNVVADRRTGDAAVVGLVHHTMRLNSLGDVNITIRMATRSSSARSESVVDAMIVPPDQKLRVARVRWTSRRPEAREYLLNNFRMSPAAFNDLFSALALDEFMDNSLKMR